MLELRPGCECCDPDLPPDSTEARICSFECTFCASCAESKLGNICPNCGGELMPRPRRPASKLDKNPPVLQRTFKPRAVLKRPKNSVQADIPDWPPPELKRSPDTSGEGRWTTTFGSLARPSARKHSKRIGPQLPRWIPVQSLATRDYAGRELDLPR